MSQQATQLRSIVGTPPPDADDPSLLARLKRRDWSAQEWLLRKEKAALQLTAMGILRSREDAGPLVADVFTDFFYSYVDGIEHERAIAAYLRIMVVRRARRLLQRQSQEDDIARHELADAHAHDVVEALETKALLPWLKNCLSFLTDRARTILRLHYGHDLGTVEIAGELGISKQAVSKTILKCVDQLRACIQRKHKHAGKRRP